MTKAEYKSKIEEGIQREAKLLEIEKSRTIKSNNIQHYSTVGSFTVAISLYCLIITILWLKDHFEPLKAVPEWFTSRKENIKAIWNCIVGIHEWGSKLLEPHMNGLLAKAIPFIIMIAIAVTVAYFVIYKGFMCLLDNWNSLWSYYEYKSQKLLKASVTVAIITVSIPLSILVVELIPSLNIISWWLILSVGLNLIYHIVTYNH